MGLVGVYCLKIGWKRFNLTPTLDLCEKDFLSFHWTNAFPFETKYPFEEVNLIEELKVVRNLTKGKLNTSVNEMKQQHTSNSEGQKYNAPPKVLWNMEEVGDLGQISCV